MRVFLILFCVATLGLSGFAAWFFFGGPEEDPARKRHEAQIAKISAAHAQAETGDLKAQYELARLYHKGDLGTGDPGEAFKWYSKAAAKGHAGSQYNLGLMHARGEHVRQNYFRAAEWYRLAANLGRYADAQFALGDLYFYGRGVPNGYAEALGWYKKAAAQGQPVAQYRLGVMYAEGWAGGFDAIRSYKWFSLSLRGKNRISAFDPELDPRAGLDHVAGKMIENQIKRAQEAVENWRRKR